MATVVRILAGPCPCCKEDKLEILAEGAFRCTGRWEYATGARMSCRMYGSIEGDRLRYDSLAGHRSGCDHFLVTHAPQSGEVF